MFNMELKKGLDAQGEDWIFMRQTVKNVSKGKFDNEVVVTDRKGNVLAIVQRVLNGVGYHEESVAEEERS